MTERVVEYSTGIDASYTVSVAFTERTVRREYDFVRRAPTRVVAHRQDVANHEILSGFEYGIQSSYLYDLGYALLYVHFNGTDNIHLTTRISAMSRAELDRVELMTYQWWPTRVPAEGIVDVAFHYVAEHGPTQRTRGLSTYTWSAIRNNYPKGTRELLDPFMNSEWRPTEGGKILHWYGPPGTGKTHAIRALIRSWSWCNASYITDPERFFGATEYMFDVLLDGDSDDYPTEDDAATEKDKRWRLVILEDCGEYMAADAQAQTGQALSRLLNSADGLIGQGLKVLFLMTTNEEIGRLHDAVKRPGRALSLVRFNPFNEQEAEEWLRARGSDYIKIPGGPRGSTLAELYAQTRGENIAEQRPRVVGLVPR